MLLCLLANSEAVELQGRVGPRSFNPNKPFAETLALGSARTTEIAQRSVCQCLPGPNTVKMQLTHCAQESFSPSLSDPTSVLPLHQ